MLQKACRVKLRVKKWTKKGENKILRYRKRNEDKREAKTPRSTLHLTNEHDLTAQYFSFLLSFFPGFRERIFIEKYWPMINLTMGHAQRRVYLEYRVETLTEWIEICAGFRVTVVWGFSLLEFPAKNLSSQ